MIIFYFTTNNNSIWYNILNNLLYNYNNSKHSLIKITPNKAKCQINLVNKRITQKAIHNLQLASKYSQINLGDSVRLSLQTTVDYRKNTFRKKYLSQWSKEIYIIVSIILAKPLSSDKYTVFDQDNKSTKRRYFRYQLQKINKNTLISIKITTPTIILPNLNLIYQVIILL